MDYKIRSTTILGVRKKNQIAIGGDGQVTFGEMAFKQKAVKVRKFETEKGIILGGFAGAAVTSCPRRVLSPSWVQRSETAWSHSTTTDSPYASLDTLAVARSRTRSKTWDQSGRRDSPRYCHRAHRCWPTAARSGSAAS